MALRDRLSSCCSRSSLWFGAFLLWGIALWILSDGPVPVRHGPELPYLDKILHFGYFFGGAGLLSAALYLRARTASPTAVSCSWCQLILPVVLILAAIGALDEWHQSWIPERSGNDPWDWLADLLGACSGALVFRRLHHLLPAPPSQRSPAQ